MTTKAQEQRISELEAELTHERIGATSLAALVIKVGEIALAYSLTDAERAEVGMAVTLADPWARTPDGQKVRAGDFMPKRAHLTLVSN